MQDRPYDHVLRKHERERGAFVSAAHYMLCNPQRAGLVKDWKDFLPPRMDDASPQLENLYQEHAPALLRYFRRQPALAGSAGDLLQDTFVRAFRGRARLRSATSPRAYLFAIARHVSIDAARARPGAFHKKL